MIILAGVLIVWIPVTAWYAYVHHRGLLDLIKAREDDYRDQTRLLDLERTARDRMDQAQAVQISVLEADIRAAQLVATSHANQLAEALAERDGIIRFLNEVPQNFNLHLPAETFAILLPDRLKMELNEG